MASNAVTQRSFPTGTATLTRSPTSHRSIAIMPTVLRPRTRGDCIDGERPCPHLTCKHHLGIDIMGDGRVRINARNGDLDLERMVDTCALDVADRGPSSLEAVGSAMHLTRERVRQLEAQAHRKLRVRDKAHGNVVFALMLEVSQASGDLSPIEPIDFVETEDMW